jgi:hypothetical protein
MALVELRDIYLPPDVLHKGFLKAGTLPGPGELH